MIDLSSHEMRVMYSFLREASELARRVQGGMTVERHTKGDLSPVTVADYAIQALAGQRLCGAFTGMTLVAEEDARALSAPEGAPVLERVVHFVSAFIEGATDAAVCEWIDRGAAEPGRVFWTLDPIDGTKGFLRGGQYAVALGLVEDGRPVLGGLACPALDAECAPKAGGGMVALARRGEGAWRCADLDGAPWRQLRVSECDDPRAARLMRSMEAAHTDTGQIDAIAREMGLAGEPVPMDSQAKFAVLAAGHGELLLRLLSPTRPDYKEKIWDHAGGAIVLEEAGGRVTDLYGKAQDFSHGRTLAANTGLLASNGALHDRALAAVRRVLAG